MQALLAHLSQLAAELDGDDLLATGSVNPLRAGSAVNASRHGRAPVLPRLAGRSPSQVTCLAFHRCMRLPAHLREDLRRAYCVAYDRQISAEEADALGIALVDALFFAVGIRHPPVHRSCDGTLDRNADKRERETT